jgi:acyl carrier protein
LSFVLALEQEFGIQISPEEIEQLLSVELTVALLEEKLGAQHVHGTFQSRSGGS